MNRLLILVKQTFLIAIFSLIIVTIYSCFSNRVGGTIAVFQDEYISTTGERRFVLKDEIEGYIIKYQKAYDCNDEFYKYNATAIVSSNSQFITIYDYCQRTELKKGDKVIIKPSEVYNEEWTIREILEPFPKESEHYGYWQCVSCRYKNAFGSIELKKS